LACIARAIAPLSVTTVLALVPLPVRFLAPAAGRSYGYKRGSRRLTPPVVAARFGGR